MITEFTDDEIEQDINERGFFNDAMLECPAQAIIDDAEGLSIEELTDKNITKCLSVR